MAENDGYAIWNPEEAIAELKLECDAMDIGNPVDTSQEMLKDSAPSAARSIIFLAVHSRDEKVRFNAARYILDKVTVGRNIEDPFADLLKQMAE